MILSRLIFCIMRSCLRWNNVGQFTLLGIGVIMSLQKASSPGVWFKDEFTVDLTAYCAAIHLLKTKLEISSYMIGGFSRRLMAIMVLID